MATSDSVKLNINASDILILAAVGAAGVGAYYLWDYFFRKSVFTIGAPSASPQYIDMGETTTISADITSESETTETVDVIFTIKQAQLVGSVLIEEKSATIIIAPGATVTASVTHVGTPGGPVSNGIAMRVVGVGTWQNNKEIGQGRLDADIFGVYITTDITFETPDVATPLNTFTGGVPDVFVGDYVSIVTHITNNGTVPIIGFTSQLTIGGIKLEMGPYTLAPSVRFAVEFSWQSTLPQELKSASHQILVSGSEIAGTNYGNILYVVLPRYLNISITGPGEVTVSPSAPWITWGGQTFKDGDVVNLDAVNGIFDHFGGDTGFGDYAFTPMGLIMNRNRNITCEFTDVIPPNYDLRVNSYNWQTDAYPGFWRVEHFWHNPITDLEEMDGFTSDLPTSQGAQLWLTSIHEFGTVGIARYDAGGNWLNTEYFRDRQIDSNALYGYFDDTKTFGRIS
jgi:hypothetical protein